MAVELSADTLKALDEIEKKKGKKKPEEKKQEEEKKEVEKVTLDLYEADLEPEGMIKDPSTTFQVSAASLCKFISTKFRQIFNDYRGCTFVAGSNMMLNFVMYFEDKPLDTSENSQVFKNLTNLTNGDAATKMERYVKNANHDRNGLAIFTLNEKTRATMDQFMFKEKRRDNLGRWYENDVDWDKCISNQTINTPMFYGARPIQVVALYNVDLIKVIANMFTTTEQKAKDKIRAQKRNNTADPEVILPSFQYDIKFKGFKQIYGPLGMGYTQAIPGFNPGDPNKPLPLDSYYINITRTDIKEALKLNPMFKNTATNIHSVY